MNIYIRIKNIANKFTAIAWDEAGNFEWMDDGPTHPTESEAIYEIRKIVREGLNKEIKIYFHHSKIVDGQWKSEPLKQ